MADTRQEWLSLRRTGVGGSDIAAIVGMSPWATPYDIWRDKRGEGEELDPDTPALYWGTVLEDVVAAEYKKRTGLRVQRVNETMRHPELDIAIANIDRAVVNPVVAGNVRWKDGRLTTDRLLECKTASGFAAAKWGEAGTDDIPEYYLLQCQWYMGITGAQYCDLAVLIGGNDYRVYSLARSNSLISDLLQEASDFWKLVESGIAPDPQTVADAQHRWQKHIPGKVEIIGVEEMSKLKTLEDIKAKIKALKSEEDAAKLEVLKIFEDAEALTHGGERVATLKAQDTIRIDSKALKAAEPDTFDLYSKTTTSRVLRISIQKDDAS